MTDEEFIQDIYAIAKRGHSKDDILDVLKQGYEQLENRRVSQRAEEIISYMVPDIRGNDDYKELLKSRRCEPIPSWWWNSASVVDVGYNKGGMVRVSIASYIGGGETSEPLNIFFPWALFEEDSTQEDLDIWIINQRAEDARQLFIKTQEQAKIQREEDLTKFYQLKAKLGVQN